MSFPKALAACLLWAAATCPVVASAEGDGGASLIQPQIGTIFWTVVTFALMLVVLKRFAWRPLLGALEQREETIRANIDEARRDREEAEKMLEEHRQLVAAVHRDRAAALAEGQQEAERVKAEILEEARKQREQLLEQTEAQVQTGMRQARAELRRVAADLVIRAAEKLLSRDLDDDAHRRLVEEHLADLESSGESGAPPS